MQPTRRIDILSLRTGPVRTCGEDGAREPMERPWSTGIFKETVAGPVRLGFGGFEGDGQGDTKHHGGPEKAVHVYPSEHLVFWRDALGIEAIEVGAFGENLSTRGAIEAEVCIGDVYEVGEALVQVSQPRQPCWRIARRWRRPDLAVLMQDSGRTGWYLRVLRPGEVCPGESLVQVDRPYPEWTVARANEVRHGPPAPDALESLTGCDALARSWRDRLARRLKGAAPEDPTPRLYGPNRVP